MTKTKFLDHIHTPDDGMGFLREVRLNGVVISYVFWANTRTGKLRHYRTDATGRFMLNRWGNRVLSRTLRGRVEVERVIANTSQSQ